MLQLNLPAYDYQVIRKHEKLYIFDVLRRKYIFLTPEEWVRQHFVHFLLEQYSYPKSLIKAESSLAYNSLSKRADLLVFDRAGQPFMLIECKDTLVPLNETVFQQAAHYNHIVRAAYLVIVNGLEWFCYRTDHAAGVSELLADLPVFPE